MTLYCSLQAGQETYHVAFLHAPDNKTVAGTLGEIRITREGIQPENQTTHVQDYTCNNKKTSNNQMHSVIYSFPVDSCWEALVPQAANLSIQKGKGIKVTSDPDAAVVVRQTYSDSESYRAIPDSQLGTDYVIGTYCTQGGFCQFAVVAIHDDTSINVIYPGEESSTCVAGAEADGQVNGNGLALKLNELDVYHFESTSDLSGTRIVGDKEFAVIVGGRDIPYSESFNGIMVEQIPPVSRWGTEFLVSPGPMNDPGDIVKIVTMTANTEVYITGHSEFIIPKAHSAIERRIDRGMDTIIRTSYPVMILQILSIHLYNSNTSIRGTPSMVVVPSTSQRQSAGGQNTIVTCGKNSSYSYVVAYTNGQSTTSCTPSDGALPTSSVTVCENSVNDMANLILTSGEHSAYAYCDPGEAFVASVNWVEFNGVNIYYRLFIISYNVS